MAEVGSLNARLTLDMSEFKAGMEQAVLMAQSLSQELSAAMTGNPFEAINRSAAESEESIKNLQGAISSFQSSLQSVSGADIFAEVKSHTAGMSEDIANATAALNNFENSATGILNTFQQLREAIEGFTTVSAETGEVFGGGENPAMGLPVVYQNLQLITNELTQINRLLQDSLGATDAWADSMNRVATNARLATTALSRGGSSSRATSSNIGAASNNMKKFANNTEKAKKGLQTAKGYAVSIKQIIGGIVISQAFYTMLGSMERLIAGAREFSATMEEASIKLGYLFSSSDKNKDVGVAAYINQMKDMSLQTGLSAATLMENAEQLQAMGFSARASVPAISILADTTAIFSSNLGEANTQMTYLIKALGQMLSSGHVSAQELRQLYNAGLPIYDILSKALNISVEEARNIGKLNYDSATAVYGILKELQRRFGGAASALTHTFNGAINVIKEGITQIVDYIWSNAFGKLSSWLDTVAQWVKALVKIGQAYGPGGIFQALFPSSAWEPIRQFISALKMLGAAIKNIMQIIGGSFLTAFKGLFPIFAQVAQRVASMAYSLTVLARYALQNIPILRKLLAAIAGLVICSVVAKLVMVLAKSFYVLSGAKLVVTTIRGIISSLIGLAATAPGVVAAILSIVAAFTILYSICGSFRNFIKGTFDKISDTVKKFSASLGDAFDTSKILTPEFKPPETADWSSGLQDLIDGWDDVSDAEDKADKKKTKYLQSFDEVYTINEKDDDGAAEGIMDIADALKDLSNLSLGDMSDWLGAWDLDWGAISSGLDGIGASAFDLKDAFSTLTEGLDLSKMATDIWDKLKSALMENPDYVGGSLGGAIGYILGRILGGPAGGIIGSILGTLAGTLAGKFWQALANAFGLGPEAATKATIASSIVSALGLIIGKAVGGTGTGLLFSLVGGATAGLVSTVWSAIADSFGYSDSTGVAQIATAIGEGIVHGIQTFASNLGASRIVAAFAGLQGATTGEVAQILANGFKISVKEGIKKGFLGAIAGIGIGFLSDILVGWLGKAVGKSTEDIKRSGTWSSWGGTILSIIGGVLGTFVFPGLGTLGGSLLGQAVGNILGGLTGLFSEDIAGFFTDTVPKALSTAWKSVSNFFTKTIPETFSNIGGYISNAWDSVAKFFTDTIPSFFSGIGQDIEEAFTSIWEGVGIFFSETLPSWWNNLGEGLSTFFTETMPQILYDAGFALGQAFGTIALAISTFFTETIPNAWNAFTEALTIFFTETIPNAWNGFITTLDEFFTSIGEKVVTFFTVTIPEAWNSFITALSNFFTVTIPNLWNSFIKSLDEFFSDVISDVKTFFTKTLPEAWDNFTAALKKFFTETIPSIWNSFMNALGEFFSGIIDAFVEFFTVTLPQKWDAFIDTVTELGKRIIDGIVNGLKSAYHTVTDWIGSFFKGFVDGFKSVFGIHSPSKEMEPLGANVMEGFKVGLDGPIKTIGSWLKDKVAGPIKNWFSDNMNAKSFMDFGKNVMEGFSDGIGSMVNKVKDAASNVCGSVVNTIKGIFNIHSPSKVTQEIGEYVGEGLLIGLKESQNELAEAATDMSNSIISAMQPEDINLFDGLEAKEDGSINKLRSWSVTFVDIIAETVSQLIDIFNSLDTTLAEAARAIATTPINANIGTISAADNLMPSPTTGTQSPVILADESIELLATRTSEHMYEYFAPLMANNDSEDTKTTIYAGTVIADDRSLKELSRKLQIIQSNEDARRGR